MINHVYVIKSDGKIIFHKTYGSVKVDDSLVSVFLSAVSSFAGSLTEGEVKSVGRDLRQPGKSTLEW